MSFQPQTPREALLEIRRIYSECHVDSDFEKELMRVDRLAEGGLRPTNPATYELTDHLADRLAEAHHVLHKIDQVSPRYVAQEINEALSLPPDLEAMIERRVHGQTH